MTLRAILVVLTCMVCATGAQACRLALVLAMDVSSSVSAQEDALQRQGLAAALTSPKVEDAFLGGGATVALAVFEWSGRYNQLILQDWVTVDSVLVLDRVAARIATTPRSHSDYPTALGHAMGFAATLLARAPTCDAKTIDVSGDGPNNDGFAPFDAYGAFPFEDVTVNGLVINVREEIAANEGQPILVDYYTQNVIRGPAAFVQVADGFEDFARAMELKLIRELGVQLLGQAPAQRPPNG